jgi:hypothetical protein
VLEIGDRPRYGRLRHRELLRRLPHTTAFHDGRKNLESDEFCRFVVVPKPPVACNQRPIEG